MNTSKNKTTIIIIAVFFFYFMIEDSLNIYIPIFFEEKKINIILYGTMLAFTRVIRAVLVIPISLLSISKKFLTLKAVIIADVIFVLAFVQTSSIVIIIVGFSVLIITTSIINVTLNPILGLQAKDRVGIVFGIRDTFLYGGCFFGLLIIGSIKSLYNNLSIIWVFYAFVFSLIFLSINKLEKELKNQINEAIPEGERENSEKEEKSKGILGLSKELFYYIVVVFVLGLAGAYSSYLPLVAKGMGLKEDSIFYIFSSSTFVSAVLALTGGVAIDRFNKKKLFQLDILILVGILMLYASGNKTIFIVAIIISGLATALDNTLNAYVFANFSEKEINRFWGVIGSVNLLSFSLGTFLGGIIYEINYNYLFVFAIGLNVLGFFLSIKLKNVEKQNNRGNLHV